MPEILAFRRRRQEDCEFKTSPGTKSETLSQKIKPK
jgi:hypothetical protein